PDPLLLAGLSTVQSTEVIRDCNDLIMIRAQDLAHAGSADAASRALAALGEIPSQGTHTLAYHLKRAQLLTQSGQKQAAALEESQARDCAPVTWSDYFFLGRADLQKGDAAIAASRFQIAAFERPTDFWSQFLLAVSSLRLAKPEPAVAALNQ